MKWPQINLLRNRKQIKKNDTDTLITRIACFVFIEKPYFLLIRKWNNATQMQLVADAQIRKGNAASKALIEKKGNEFEVD